jgi:nicotinic acid mononucleotide adenylyltransferase
MEMASLKRVIQNVIEVTNSAGMPQLNLVQKAKKGISGPNQKLGVLPASFDPLTKAHVAMVSEARKWGLDEILLLLDTRNADKKSFAASLEDRILLVTSFFKEEDVSVALSSHGLFLEKLRALKRLYPPSTRIYFLAGYDTILRVLDKKYYRDREAALDELFGGSEFLIAGRGDKGEKEILSLFEKEENKRFKSKIKTINIAPFTFISATEIRRKIKRGESLEALMPEDILPFINEIYKR